MSKIIDPLTLEQLQRLAVEYRSLGDLRRLVRGIVDKLIQQQTAINLMVDLMAGRKA